MNKFEEVKLGFEQTSGSNFYSKDVPGFDARCICPVCGDGQWFSNAEYLDERCELYKLGYRMKVRCREWECRKLFISKDTVKNKDLIQDLKELEDMKFEKYNETEFNTPWYYVKSDYGEQDDFVYNCMGEEVLGNEQYYPICSMDEPMMKRLVDIVNNTKED